jgi:hypothetical protein
MRWKMRWQVGLGLLAAGVMGSAGCYQLTSDCSLFYCGGTGAADGGDGGDGGDSGPDGEGGPPPLCIPSLSSAPVADTCGVFVSSAQGDDTNGKGTKEAPYKTIGKALAENASTVYACAGTLPYSEAVTLSNAVTLFGAVDCTSWAYNATTKTQLTAPNDAVPLTVTTTASGSTVEDFAITAADATKAGGSSIAVIANGVNASMIRVDITVGSGKDGLAGTTPTMSVGPTSPSDPTIVGVAGQNACIATSQQFGGAAVTNPMCASTGGKGGDGAVANGSSGDLQPTASAQTALGGVGQPNVDPGSTWSCLAGSGLGAGGTTGTNGTPGTGAKSTDLGTLDAASGYTGVAGQPAGAGQLGQGGGGGGGAKGKSMCAGGSGGSGGAGGCGGNGGTGGTAGGASIGIVSLGATLVFNAVTISVGTGGKGGDGGGGQVGGVGGNGGEGGLGNNASQNLSSACSGGAGGPGGTGGTGGGGRGGHAIGIAYTGMTGPTMTGVSFPSQGTAGMGGVGDNSMGNMGNGAQGVVADVQGF